MRNWFLGALVVLSSSFVSADVPERKGILSSKVVLEDSEGYFGLSDGSCWKAIGFIKRWRSVSEWWSDAEIIPESYNTLPVDWYIGAEIEVYPKCGNLEVSEADASNEADLRSCTHLLYNPQNGQVLFAIPLKPAEALTQLSSDSRKQGYNEGYRKGEEEGYKKGLEEGSKKRTKRY